MRYEAPDNWPESAKESWYFGQGIAGLVVGTAAGAVAIVSAFVSWLAPAAAVSTAASKIDPAKREAVREQVLNGLSNAYQAVTDFGYDAPVGDWNQLEQFSEESDWAFKAFQSEPNPVWNMPGRGLLIEDMNGGNLPANFKTFDAMDWNSGVATSIKSVDIRTPYYTGNAMNVFHKGRAAINAMIDFEGYSRMGVVLRDSQISEKVLKFGNPLAE